MRPHLVFVGAGLVLSLAASLGVAELSVASASASGSGSRVADPLAVKVWTDSGQYSYAAFRVWFEMKDPTVTPDRYQMRVRRDGPRRELTDWNLRRFVLPRTGVNLRQGARACIQVRAKDAGVAGPWSRTICRVGVIPGYRFEFPKTTRDERDWFPLAKGRSAFGGTVLYTDDADARAYIEDLQVKRIKLWALRCGNCGNLEISFRGRTTARRDLSARKRHSDLVWQHEFNRPRHGRLTITVTSEDGRLVQLDAAAIERDNRLSRAN